jgi:beta-mannosidase
VDPFALRAVDPERYLALSRAVSGEVMLRVFAEWRRPGSGCGGGLVWFLKDLRPGAGWGILDSLGQPKAPWWVLRRAWARRAVLLTDEGLNGVAIHLLNETAEPLAGEVELALLRGGRALQTASAPAEVAPFGAVTLSGDALLGGFFDAAHAYRFGPPAHDVVVARLRAAGDRAVLSEDALFPGGHSLPRQPLTAVKADAVADGGDVVVTLEAEVFLQSVSVQCRGYIPEDNFFHLSPGLPRSLRFSAEPGARAFKAYVSALNLEGSLTVRS